MSSVITDDVGAYMSRDWDAVRRWKDEYCAERIARLGPMEAFRMAEGLRPAGAVDQSVVAHSRRVVCKDDMRAATEALVRAWDSVAVIPNRVSVFS